MPIEILLLLALPASGKSEVRRYLESLDPETALNDLRLRPTVQLDDYDYVHMMRRISEETRTAGDEPPFFRSGDEPFLDPRDWLTLVHLLNFDYADLTERGPDLGAGNAARWLFDRIDRARREVGLPEVLGSLAPLTRERLESALEVEAQRVFDERQVTATGSLEDRTVIIELARGGPEGSSYPLPSPYGYQHSLQHLATEILEKARIMYIWVEPDESRRKNLERAVPGREGDASILNHGVPEAVMRREYGTDDLMWLLAAGGGSYVFADKDGRQYGLPTGVFDNRSDMTSFLRADPEEWSQFKVRRLHEELLNATAGFRV
jgi:hypothetical protein